ncbi:hypothetical protein [Phormidium sp. CCY1219]|nr:hypothetical protein [Phormidium sp. CCY1219]MEB3830840.1 hypothetical protein [Phormidium sp. CCY1219]
MPGSIGGAIAVAKLATVSIDLATVSIDLATPVNKTGAIVVAVPPS